MYRPRRGGSGVEKGGDACVALVPNTNTGGDACVALVPNTNTGGDACVALRARPLLRHQISFRVVVEPWANPFS